MRHFILVAKYQNISTTFIIGIFQFDCKSEHKQVKWNETDIFKADSIFSYLQNSNILRTVTKEKVPLFNFIP